MILKSFPKQGSWMSRVGEELSMKVLWDLSAWINSAWRSRASLLTQDRLSTSLCSACSPMCHPLFQALLSCMRSQHPSHCPFPLMACVLHPLFIWVYATLSIFIPGALCTSCHGCSVYLSLFSLYRAKSYCYLLFRPISTSPFLVILGFLLSHHLRVFMWQLLTRPLCFSSSRLFLGEDSSGCMRGSAGKMGKMKGGHCWGGTY